MHPAYGEKVVGDNRRRDILLLIGAVALVFVLGVIALSREGRPLDGRWELTLIELPSSSITPVMPSWIEIDDTDLIGVGECFDMVGTIDSGSGGFSSEIEFAARDGCQPTDVDHAYIDHFWNLSVAKQNQLVLTLQSAGAAVEFHYERAR